MDNKKLLDAEIERLLAYIETLTYGTDERRDAVSELEKLYKLRIEDSKVEQAYELDGEKLFDQTIERYFKYGAMVLELIVPIIAYGIWYKTGLKFEETGSVTSPMTRNLMSKMLPKK